VFVSEEEHNSTWVIQLIPETQDRNAHHSIAAISNTLHLMFVLRKKGAFKKTTGTLMVKHFVQNIIRNLKKQTYYLLLACFTGEEE
jgi:hypothetical protein